VVEHSVVLLGPRILTKLPGVAVPLTVGLVVVSVPVGPLIATVGAGIAVTLSGALVQPPLVQAITVRLVIPAVSETGQANVPDTLAVVLHKVLPDGSVIVTNEPGVAVPVIGCVVGPGTDGATVRLGVPVAVKLLVVAVAEPPELVATAVSVCGPGDRLTTQE
jgi:hypothetical protein